MKFTCLALIVTGPLLARPYFTEPAISPDNSEIAFVSGGDIWTVPVNGGVARLLISNPATESRPLYSPDGKRLAFVSTRTGNGDIYVLNLGTGELKRITFDDAPEELDAWSRDGKYLYFSSTSNDIAGMNDIYRVNAAGGTPMIVSGDRYANEYFAAPAPSGDMVAFTARGIVSAQWWRNGHSHIDESEIWLLHDRQPPKYERVSEGQAKELWPMWSADGKELFYVSDRDGAQNIMRSPLGGAPRKITSFTDDRVLWPSIAYDGTAIVFARDFRIWKLDVARGHAEPLNIELRGAPAGAGTTHLSLTNGFSHLALSHDGKKAAFVAHGEIFAASAKDGGAAVRVTHSPANETDPNWAPDNHRLAYVSDRQGVEHLFVFDFDDNSEKQLTKGSEPDAMPRWSHDGKSIAYVRGGRELRALDVGKNDVGKNDVGTNNDRVLASTYIVMPPIEDRGQHSWSPDDHWVAFFKPDERYFHNVEIVAATGGSPRAASFLANVNAESVSWSPDGTFLLFDSGQRTEPESLARVDLIPRTPRFREDQFRDLFRETNVPSKPAAPPSSEGNPPKAAANDSGSKNGAKPVQITFDGIRGRLSLLPVGLDAHEPSISPDGKTLLFIAEAAGQQNLYTYSLDELAKDPPVARQLTSTAGRKADAQWSPDGKEVFYLENGEMHAISVENRQDHTVAVTAEMDVDFGQEKREVFHQAWSYLNHNFYDPKMHGVDWAKMRERYEPVAEGAQTPDELRQIIVLMIGELNASHCGISAGGTPQRSTGRLGLRFDRAGYESQGWLKVAEVVALSPAALTGNLKPGDFLLAVDGRPIDAHTNLDELLDHRIDKRVVLTVADAADGTGKREAVVRPVNLQTEKGLLYRQWVEQNREYVARASSGRVGYVHMLDMSSNALEQLLIDLDSENQNKDGVIIDVRNNNGGFVNAYALDVLSRRHYLNMTIRGFTPVPARGMLGQRALEKPTVLVTSQASLSDAEDFAEGYRSMKLGKVVGEPTAGWIIYTWGTGLIDGSVLRLPHMRITATDGSNMEGHPRPVDMLVVRPMGESYTGKDSQLDAAVKELLGRSDARTSTNGGQP